jgi:predicted nucleotidyltransferase
MVPDTIKNEIINNITSKKPYKVFLFGSYAYGSVEKDSDIDLLVVVNKEGVPKNYQEKSENYLEISRALRSLNKKIPMDILVMTKTQWIEFVRKKSGFAREILEKGVELL